MSAGSPAAASGAPAPADTSDPARTPLAGAGGDSAGIATRPEIDPMVLAVIAAAVDQTWPRPRVVVTDEVQRPPAWRFSGRWWSRPATTRRERPWAGG